MRYITGHFSNQFKNHWFQVCCIRIEGSICNLCYLNTQRKILSNLRKLSVCIGGSIYSIPKSKNQYCDNIRWNGHYWKSWYIILTKEELSQHVYWSQVTGNTLYSVYLIMQNMINPNQQAILPKNILTVHATDMKDWAEELNLD